MTSALPSERGRLAHLEHHQREQGPEQQVLGQQAIPEISRHELHSGAHECGGCTTVAGLGDDRGGCDPDPEREQQRHGKARSFAEVHIAHRRGLIRLAEQQFAREAQHVGGAEHHARGCDHGQRPAAARRRLPATWRGHAANAPNRMRNSAAKPLVNGTATDVSTNTVSSTARRGAELASAVVDA